MKEEHTAIHMTESKEEKESTDRVLSATSGKITCNEVLNPNWKEYFSKEETIKEILHSVEMDDQKLARVYRIYAIDNDRLALILDTINMKTLDLNRIILDIIIGEPTWDQMMDVTFGVGSECNPRIIVFHPTEFPAPTIEERVAGFAQICNDCGLRTFLLGAKRTPTRVIYKEVTQYAMCGKSNLKILPTREEFQHTEFMFNVTHILYGDRLLEKEYFTWPAWTVFWELEGFDLELMFPLWKEDGLFMFVTATSAKGQEQLKWLLENKRHDLEKEVGGGLAIENGESGLPQELSARIWQRPFSEYVFQSEDKKYELAEVVLDMNQADKWYLEDLLKECKI